MSRKVFIGWDNGVTGTLGILTSDDVRVIQTPVQEWQDYTKKKKKIHRVDFDETMQLLEPYAGDEVKVMIERPLKNPRMFKATVSGIRAFEIQLLLVQDIFKFSYEVIMSKKWQSKLLPKGTKGRAALKRASVEKGVKLYPQLKEQIEDFGDADGLLIAEYCKRLNAF